MISKEQEELVKAGLRIDREHKRRQAVGRIADGILALLTGLFVIGMYALVCWIVSETFTMFGKPIGVLDAAMVLATVAAFGGAWYGDWFDTVFGVRRSARKQRERE